MAMSDVSEKVAAILIGIILGALVGASGMASFQKFKWERQAIEHKAAYYHPETGAFTWKKSQTLPASPGGARLSSRKSRPPGGLCSWHAP